VKKEYIKTVILMDFAFVVYVIFFVWLSGIGPLVAQVWHNGGFSFTLSTREIIRLVGGIIGLAACFVVLGIRGKNYKKQRVR